MRFIFLLSLLVPLFLVNNYQAQALTREQRITVETLTSLVRASKNNASNVLFLSNKIAGFDPNNNDVIAYRAVSYCASQDYQESLKQFNNYLKIKSNSSVYSQRAKLKLMMGDTMGCLQDIEKALSVSGYNEDVIEEISEFWPSDKRIIPCLEKAIKLHPNNFFAYAMMGNAKRKSNDLTGAEKQYSYAIQVLEKNIFYGRVEHRSIYRAKASVSFRLGHYKEAIETITEAILLYPTDIACYRDRIIYYRESGEQVKACEDMMQVQRMDKNYSPLFKISCDSTNRDIKRNKEWSASIEAQKLYLEGYSTKEDDSVSVKKEIENYSKALEIKPDHIYALAARSSVYSLFGEYGKAVQDLDRILRIRPNSAITFHYRSIAKRHLNNYRSALVDSDSSIYFEPTNLDYLLNRVAMETDMGDTSKAISDLEKAVALDPFFDRVYFEKGVLEFNKKEYDKALKDFSKAIEIRENNPFIKKLDNYYYFRALVYDKLMFYQNAITDLDIAIAVSPNDSYYYYLSGEIKARMKNMIDACNDWNKAKQLGYEKADQVLFYNCADKRKGQ